MFFLIFIYIEFEMSLVPSTAVDFVINFAFAYACVYAEAKLIMKSSGIHWCKVPMTSQQHNAY